MAPKKMPAEASAQAPLRRAHTKSRKGCLQCKESHRKCDEKLPKCGGCEKRQIRCSFQASESTTRTPLLQWNEELDLFHYFTMTTSNTLSRGHDLEIWQVTVPRVACQHGFLLDSILAVASSQRAIIEDDEDKTWERTAINYQSRALDGFKPVLTNLDTANHQAAFAFSILIMVTAFSLLGADHADPHTDILNIRGYLSGIGAVSFQFADRLRNGPFGGLFRDAQGKDLAMFWDVDTPDLQDMSPLPQPSLNQSLENLYLLCEQEPDSTRDISKEAVSKLVLAHERYVVARSLGAVVSWPVMISDQFMCFFNDRRPMAMLVFAHYGAVIHLMHGRWWARNAGRRLGEALLMNLQPANEAWAASIESVRRALAH